MSGNNRIHADIFIGPMTHWHNFLKQNRSIFLGNGWVSVRHQTVVFTNAILSSVTTYQKMYMISFKRTYFNTLRTRQKSHHITDGIFKCIFSSVNLWTMNEISLRHVPWGLIDNMAAFDQIMAWSWIGIQHQAIVWSNVGMFCFIYWWLSTRMQ